MLTLILFIFLSVGVSIINGSSCACCFPWVAESCQTPGFPVFCENCTSFFCANHVKGCQGTPCKAVCIPDSSSTTTTVSSSSSSMEPITTMMSSPFTEPITTMMSSSSSMEPITNTTASGGYFIRIELFVISASLTLLILCQLNL